MFRNRILQYAAVALSAGAMWASFPDVNLWFLSVPSLALLIGVLDGVGVARSGWYSWLWGFLFFLPHISWINIATGGIYFAWILLAAVQATYFAVWGACFTATKTWRWGRTWWGQALFASVLWVGVEQFRARFPYGGFPWAKVAYAQVDSPLITLAPWGGEVLVSGTVLVLATLLWWALKRGVPRHERLSALVTAALLVVGPAMLTLPTGPESGEVRAALIQGNVEIPMFETYGVAGKVTTNHLDETIRMAAEGAHPQVVIWGEDSIDRDPTENQTTNELVNEALRITGVPLVAGFQEVVGDIRYNWMSVWYPAQGEPSVRYGKQHPVPWGEYIPLRGISEFLAVEAAQIGVDMVPVDNPGFLEVTLNDGRTVPFSVGICFEVADEHIIAQGVRMGGQLILIPTNNSHFRYSAESTQQLQMLRFRAAEFSRAGMQVSTNGVSAVISPDGSILQITERQVAAHLVADMPLRTTMTPAAQSAQFLPIAAIIAAFVVGAAAQFATHQRRANRQGKNP